MILTTDQPEVTEAPAPDGGAVPTLWGLTPVQLHDRFWAARGVQVVRLGENTELVPNAELFLLTTPATLVLFRLAPLIDRLSWEQPELLWLRLAHNRDRTYREYALRDSRGQFLRFERRYAGQETRIGRVALTGERTLAELWQRAADPRQGWARMRRATFRRRRASAAINGRVYRGADPQELMRGLRDLVGLWKQPDATIHRAHAGPGEIWRDTTVTIPRGITAVGPVWIGAGRQIDARVSLVGPTILWDAPDARPEAEILAWDEIEPGRRLAAPTAPRPAGPPRRVWGKRLFDIAFAALVLLVTAPLFPLVMLATWLEDGRPFFFIHHRQGRGGSTFPCIKFRSMRKDADQIKQELLEANQVDGPQFYMEADPRLTRVGRFIRKTNIDELPQFVNVLLGQMSVVGPRPSPDAENQYCPAWREARLSVRPGITGLWQVRRSREPCLDFQEWIRYDIEYVETMSWRTDLRIILETFRVLLRGN